MGEGTNWIQAIQSVNPWTMAAIAISGCVVLFLRSFGVPLLQNLPELWATVILTISITAACLLLARWSESQWHRRSTSFFIWKRWTSLKPVQKEFLVRVFNTGHRKTEIEDDGKRWVEELEEWGYIKDIPRHFFPSNPRKEVTRRAWRKLEQLRRLKKI